MPDGSLLAEVTRTGSKLRAYRIALICSLIADAAAIAAIAPCIRVAGLLDVVETAVGILNEPEWWRRSLKEE